MKKGVLVLLAVVVCLMSCTVNPIDDASFETSVEDGNATITGYTGSGGNVVIPPQIYDHPVIAIGDEAFLDKGLTGLTIPDSVTTIGYFAFANNYLSSVVLPNSVTTIKSSAFLGNRLSFVTISDSLTAIENMVFQGNQLISVTIPASVTAIGLSAFEGNPLTSITIGTNVTVSPSAFPYLFSGYYQDHGRQAGEYAYNGTSWSYSPR
ncbi:MAG: leucine-rich repeat domain-containing protein [Spirochaetaceae bacterium]|jgi:hypothetical protein|nr:leucine-rich repeat domain-containing protein [Spirochaetaceae bacterium]